MPLIKLLLLLTLLLFANGGCFPITSTHYVVEPAGVKRVTVWEDRRPPDGDNRFAVVTGDEAVALAKTMTYERQDNPFFKILGACSCKPDAAAIFENSNGTSLSVGFRVRDHAVMWKGPGGSLSPAFGPIYDDLPWQAGKPEFEKNK